MKNDADDAEEYEETYMESALGWGGMIIGPDGIGRPMPEDEALTAVIPEMVGTPEQLDDDVRIFLEVLGRPEQSVRLAAVIAIGEVARRYGRLPDRTNARGAVMRVLTDPSPEVRTAAAATLGLIDQHSA